MFKKILAFVLLAVVLGSCASKKKIGYFQNINSVSSSSPSNYETRLQPDDELLIIVSAPSPTLAPLAEPFNLSTVAVMSAGSESLGGGMRFQSYLIDKEGMIEFPVIGKIKLAGLTRAEAVEKLRSSIDPYLKNPIVNLRIRNFDVSVVGEVNRPGSYTTNTERLTLPEALALAGDLTIYGNRKNILLIRDDNGVKTHNYIDLTKADFINSDLYYLKQNDYIYVEPNRTKMNASTVGPNITVGISAISLLITIIAFVTR